jgi:NAD(P)-dependent dehydrogenase (short-subunit alcohol dehydrogenase family)
MVGVQKQELVMPGPLGKHSTTDDVLAGLNLRGKRFLVTGTSAGLGVETARSLAAHGAWVVGAARDLSKAHAATQVVREQARDGGGIELVQLDLGSLASIRACAAALVALGKHLDVIIANAGVMACPKSTTKDGFETQFGTNHLGHFVLINRLVPLLDAGSRVISLSSAGHSFADVDLDDPNFERTPYAEFLAYGRSKTANALFAVEFDRRHRDRGVRAAAVHPGGIQTELGRHLTPEVTREMIALINPGNPSPPDLGTFKWKTIPQGAATSLWAAVLAPSEVVGGRYCEDCHVAETKDSTYMGLEGVRRYAIDPARARALWKKSEELVGEHF